MKQEYLDVMKELRKHHSLFAMFWSVGRLVEIKHPRMPTAGIAFDKETGAGLQFLINPDYWEKLTDYDKAFVLSHECLHVYFDHGRRSLTLDHKIANYAQDIVINHYLVDVFGFERERLTFGETYCWRDTMFPGQDDIEEERSFEYYYNMLQERGLPPPQQGDGEPGEGQPGDGEGEGGESGASQGMPQTVDVHDFMGEDDIDDEMRDAIRDAIQEMAEEIMDSMSPEEFEDFEEKIDEGNKEAADDLRKAQKGGPMGGTMKMRVRLGRIVKKPKWETVVANEIGRLAGMQRDLDIELWTRPNRRLASMGGELMLPATVNETVPVRDRIDVWFFQDTSGSCVDYAKRFFAAAASIPEDRFRIRMFCFDTRVYETTLESGKLYGFGGTKFQPIEDAIQQITESEGCLYPQAVFVITDGENWGEPYLSFEHAERWHWFITAGGNKRSIPKDCHTYNLEDYE